MEDSKDAMESIKEVVEQKVEEVITNKVVDQKIAEVAPQVVESAAKVVDWVDVKVETKTEEVAAKVDELLKPATAVLAKLEENPEIKKAVDAVVAQVDGRMVTCWCCCGWDLSLRISRRNAKTSLDKQVVAPSVVPLPAPSSQSAEVLPPKVESPPSEVRPLENITVSV